MEEEGLIIRAQNRRYSVATGVPPVGIVEAHSIDENGELVGKAIGWKANSGNSRIIILSSQRNSKHQTLAIGERALVRLKSTGNMEIEARIMKRLQERTGTIIGVVKKTEHNAEIRSVDRRGPQDIYIEDISEHNIEDGDIVLTRLEGKKVYGRPQATIEKVLGKIGKPGAIETIVCASHDIPAEFSKESNSEALVAGPPNPKGREDLTTIPLVTIDDEDARDFDDAVWAEPDKSLENSGGWNLITAIADVSSYVKAGQALDKEAQKRGNSVYLPSRVIPMLPESLSNEWCSLKPNKIRACIAVRVCVSKTGEIKHYRFIRGIMRSVARLTYSEVDAYKRGGSPPPTKTIGTQIDNLYGAYEALRQARINRNTLDFDLPEKRIVFGRSGEVTSIETRPHYDSHRLIEEFMIAANVVAAKILKNNDHPLLYRVHEEPPKDKLDAFRDFADSLKLKFPKRQVVQPSQFNKIIESTTKMEIGPTAKKAVLRAQSKAQYTPENYGHFGLSLHHYCHFTSPIRRYADLLIHRTLISTLNLGDGGCLTDQIELRQIGDHLSITEQRAVHAERDTIDRFSAAFFIGKIGQQMTGVISGVAKFGLFVSLDGFASEGLVPIRSLHNEYFHFNESQQSLKGQKTGNVLQVGDSVNVLIEGANPINRSITLKLVDYPNNKSADRHKVYKFKKRAR